MTYNYKTNTNLSIDDLIYYEGEQTMWFDLNDLVHAIHATNEEIQQQYVDSKKYIAPLLMNVPLKNLSGSVGEALGQHVANITGTFKKNPHEAGAPDFLPLVESSKSWFDKPTQKYFELGGFDTKASYAADKKFASANASSHHDQTTTVFVVQWTFSANKVPEIIGVYYTNKLTRLDWKLSRGKVGSKTTNAAMLTASGKDKLRRGWIILREDVKLPRVSMRNKYGIK